MPLIKLQKEIQLGRIAGPFDKPPFPIFHISPLALREKKTPGEYRLLHNLSHPYDTTSINGQIPNDHRHVKYATVGHAISKMLSLPKGSFAAKTDIANVFRLIPIKPKHYHKLGMKFQGAFYFDKVLPQGLASSYRIFEFFSTAVHWILETRIPDILCVHYVDDFLIIARSTLNDIQVWIDFMNLYNGITFFRHQKIFTSEEINMYSDASSIAFGATYGKQWIQAKWPPSWKKFHISVLELYPIFVLISIFAPLLRNSNILFHSDNSAVVTMINKQTSKNKPAMAILRKLVLTLMQFNVSMHSEHIPGINNVLADRISRLQVTEQLLARYGMRLKPSIIIKVRVLADNDCCRTGDALELPVKNDLSSWGSPIWGVYSPKGCHRNWITNEPWYYYNCRSVGIEFDSEGTRWQ